MKKIAFLIVIVLSLICRVTAVEPQKDTLTKIESKMLGIEYPDQKLEKRLERLEEYLYGSKKQGNAKVRLSKIVETTKCAMLESDNKIASNDFENSNYVEPIDDSVDYPILDDVEKKLGLGVKSKAPLNSRLAIIEKKMFNATHEKEDYFDRVERIKTEIYKGKHIAKYDVDDFDNPSDVSSASSFNDSFFLKGASTVSYKLSLLEQRLLKNTFEDETNNDRLARLENAVFETQFYNQDENERINRLEAVLIAKKSSPKYDHNKFQQGMNTAMQIGAMVLMVLAFIL